MNFTKVLPVHRGQISHACRKPNKLNKFKPRDRLKTLI